MDAEYYQDEFKKERRARLAAERLLEQKQSQLIAANRKLSQHALNLSDQIVDQRKVLDKLQDENSEATAQNLKANHKALAAERLLWDAVKSIQDGFALFDKDRKLIAANSAYLGLFQSAQNVGPGISLESILDLCLEDNLIDRDGRSEDDWYDFMLARLIEDVIEPVILQLHNGIFVKLVDRRTADGGIVSLALNITDTIRREEELLEARDTALAADRAKSAFLAKMSHEFRTPINGVVGMADLLLDRATDEEGLLYANTIKTSAQSLLDFVNNVLEYATIEAGNVAVNSLPFTFEDIVDTLKASVPVSDLPEGVEVLFETDTRMPQNLVGDARRIGQIVKNLYSNALKNTVSGSVLVRSIWRDDGQDTKLLITVEDTGIGIPSDKLDHIFNGFSQTDDSQSRQHDGAGLGLSIAQKLVDALGGEIAIISVDGEGSQFEVTIPVSSPDPATNIEPIHKGSAILVSQDILARSSAARVFEMCHITFEEAETIPTNIANDVNVAFVDATLAQEAQAAFPKLRVIEIGSEATEFSSPYRASDLTTLLEQPVAIQNAVARAVHPPIEKLIVLAAEDNKTNQLVFQKMLKDTDIDLTIVSDGLEAVEAYKSKQPHLIFMDISMPKMDGMEATQQIRWHEAETGAEPTPIVAMTAHATEDDEARIRNCGLDHYMTKPLNKAAIVEMITNVSKDLGIIDGQQKAS